MTPALIATVLWLVVLALIVAILCSLMATEHWPVSVAMLLIIATFFVTLALPDNQPG